MGRRFAGVINLSNIPYTQELQTALMKQGAHLVCFDPLVSSCLLYTSTDGATLSLSGAELDGVPMFWLNGSMVNPFGGTIFDKNPASAAEDVYKRQDLYVL